MDSQRFARLIERIDQLNRDDPHTVLVGGTPVPWELFYAERLTDWVRRLAPNASEELRIAARGQHIRRWTIPRSRYEMTRRGYLRWRETLKAFHTQTVGGLMRETGYPEPMIRRVQQIMGKRHLAEDPETQTLEDALCLVFLDTQFAELRKKTPADTMQEIVRKTWQKMSEQGRATALQLPLSEEEKRVIAQALSEA